MRDIDYLADWNMNPADPNNLFRPERGDPEKHSPVGDIDGMQTGNTCNRMTVRSIRPAPAGGAVTVEAALILPVLLCVFLTVVFIIKAVYTYGIMQHALDETASEIASAGYIYHVSGLRDIHDTARDGVNEKAEQFRNQIGTVFDTYNSLKDVGDSLGQGLSGVSDSTALLENAGENFEKLLESAETAVTNPVDELKSIACYIAAGALDDAKTQLFTPVVKLYMKKYLVTGKNSDIDERLKALNIKGGMSGLDFSESSFLTDAQEDIDIVVRYEIKLPLPVQFISRLEIVQRAKAKAWLGGDESTGIVDRPAAADDIWSLSNFQRGRKIQKLFGANLPSNFPVIAKFEHGKAIMIKSMDLTADSYQKGDHAQKTLQGYLDELSGYNGQEKPWGSSKTVIRSEDINSRELLLVIPQNTLSQSIEALLAEMTRSASSQGITLVIKRYGTKVVKEAAHSGEETQTPSTTDESDTTDPSD